MKTATLMHEPKPDPDKTGATEEQKLPPRDLERCPRCGYRVEEILWGHTDCPNCGLHFECC